MKKYFNLFFTIFVLFFITSCSPVEHIHTLEFSIDNDVYSSCDQIALKIKGTVDSNYYKTGEIYISFTNIDNLNLELYDISYQEDSDYLNFIERNGNTFKFELLANTYTNINEIIYFNITDIGKYNIMCSFYADRISPTPLVYYCTSSADLQLTVTE